MLWRVSGPAQGWPTVVGALALLALGATTGCTGVAGESSERPGEPGSPGGNGQPGGNGNNGNGNSGNNGSGNGSGNNGGPGPSQPGPSTPGACKADQIGVSPMRRLTRLEYDNSVRELLGVDLGLGKEFSEDEKAGVFPGNFFAPISEMQFGQYASGAVAVAGKAVEKLNDLIPCAAGVNAGNEAACASTFIKQFGRRAYRRPMTNEEVGRYEALFRTGREGTDFKSGIELVVQAMVESPHFLYLVEGPGALTQHQLAARLSYFLWNGPPDAQLAGLADAGNLKTVESLRKEAQRMLADARAQDMIDDFHFRWLNLEDLVGSDKDPEKFPEFEALRPAMREELKRFTNHVLAEGDGKLKTLLTAPFTIATGPLAKLYGASASGDAWQKVNLDPKQRAGIFSQSAFLAAHGHEGAAPIFRGVAIREQVLCSELPPPPPGADQALPPPSPSRTTRQRMELHRQDPQCASCHSMMDPIGYAFESFDDMGGYRNNENNLPIDDNGELTATDVDSKFKGPVELAQKLAGSKQVQQCLVNHWFRYATGRLETKLDECTVQNVLSRFQGADLRVPDLLLALVESDVFRIRRPEEAGK